MAMHSVQIHKIIDLITSLFYLIGVWHRGDKPTVKETRLKLFYCIYLLLFFISIAVGAVINVKREMMIFLAELAIATAVMGIKICFLIWKQNQIVDLLNRVCVFTISHDDDYNIFSIKLKGFMKFAFVFLTVVILNGCSGSVILSLLGSEKNLFLEIAFPLDYKTNEVAFWIATFFIFIGFLFVSIGVFFTVIIWYLLLICSLRYEVLGNELKILGQRSETRKGKQKESQMQNDFVEDLEASINSHIYITRLTIEIESFFGNIFFTQFGTSGLCICGSIYCLAFNIGDTALEYVLNLLLCFYFIADLFMITYIGNEIMLSSDRLTYSLFESDWYNQSQSTKKSVIIFGEYLKQPKQILIGKLYTLTLETFTRILNSAYSMFNILKNFQQ